MVTDWGSEKNDGQSKSARLLPPLARLRKILYSALYGTYLQSAVWDLGNGWWRATGGRRMNGARPAA